MYTKLIPLVMLACATLPLGSAQATAPHEEAIHLAQMDRGMGRDMDGNTDADTDRGRQRGADEDMHPSSKHKDKQKGADSDRGKGDEMRERRDERKQIMEEHKGATEPGEPQGGKKPWWKFWQ